LGFVTSSVVFRERSGIPRYKQSSRPQHLRNAKRARSRELVLQTAVIFAGVAVGLNDQLTTPELVIELFPATSFSGK